MNNFKVGDIVVNNDLENPYVFTTKENSFVGEVVEVDTVFDEIKVNILENVLKEKIGKVCSVHSQYFKLQEEPKKFKVGDIIVNNERDNGYVFTTKESCFVGEVYEVGEHLFGDIQVKVLENKDKDDIGRLVWVQSEYFKLHEGLKRFNVGDMVYKIKQNGETVFMKVTGYNNDSHTIECESLDGTIGYYSYHEIESAHEIDEIPYYVSKELASNLHGTLMYNEYIEELLEENARLDEELKRLEKTTEFDVYFDDEKETTLLLDDDGNFTTVRTMRGDTYSREQGFLVAFFQHTTGMTKTQANKFLKSLSQEDE